MPRISIKLVLTSLFLLSLAVSAGQGLYSLWALRSIDAGVKQTADKRVPSLILLGQLNADTGDVRVAQADLLSASTDKLPTFTKELEEAQKRVAAERVSYEPLMVDEDDHKLFSEFAKSWDASEAIWPQVLSLAQSNQTDKATALFLGASKEAYDKAGEAIQKAVDDLKGNVSDETSDTRQLISSATLVAFIALVGGMVVVLLALAVCVLRIIKPINQLVQSMLVLAKGDKTAPIPYAKRPDEIGDMARSVLVFQQSAIENERLEKQALQHGAEAERARTRSEEMQRQAIEAERATVASSLGTALRKLAEKDLTYRMPSDIPEAYRKLQADFNDAIGQLQQTMKVVAINASAIQGGTGDISTGADNLSRRTEQQAASLEETAAALDQITVTVRKTSEGASHAQAVVDAAKVAAERSGQIVRQAVEAMSGIEKSSQQIGQIITVIDEIAFQTNLLALNAGVEAARAGEAGRGFAVVASEVRALAQRSAEAAKEIKTLISTSTAQVERGVELVDETGQALADIVTKVSEINKIVFEIAASAREQASGLAEVNTAINQMDQVTQQNAAMVEESTAASRALEEETNGLARLVAAFRTGEQIQQEPPLANRKSAGSKRR